MAKLESGAQVAKRRRLISALLGAGVAVVLLTVAATYWWSRSREQKPSAMPPSLPRGVGQQLSGYTFTRSDGGRQIFAVHAARTVAFKEGGTTVLEDVLVEVFGRTGSRRDVLRTRRCDYNAESGDLFSAGKVEIELDARRPGDAAGARPGRTPVHLETSRLSFRQRGSLVVSNEPVQYRIGPASGSALGLEYSTRDGWLELEKDVYAELRTSAFGEIPLELRAARARYDKEAANIELWGRPVEFRHAERRITSDHAQLFLDGENRVTRAVLGGVEAFDCSPEGQTQARARQLFGDFDPATGELKSLRAEGDVTATTERRGSLSRLRAGELEISFAGSPPQAQKGRAGGGVRLAIESAGGPTSQPTGTTPRGSEEKELAAAEVTFAFRRGGRSLNDAQTVGPGTLELVPADPRIGKRVITAGQFLMSFDSRNGLESLRGVSGTEIAFHPPLGEAPGREISTSSAETLTAAFSSSTQELRAVHQAGDFRFRDGDREAKADQADYRAANETLTLTGRPRLTDPNTRILAHRIVFDLRTDRAEGSGGIQSTHSEGAVPGEGRLSDPTNVFADRVVAERRGQVVHYEGSVRVWRGQDVVESSSLDIDRTHRQVRSGLRVKTSHLQPAALSGGEAGGVSGGEMRPVTIEADRLEYFDQGRKASYRGNVRLRAEQTTLRADGMDVYFALRANGQDAEVERAVAEGDVEVKQPARRATGSHAEYFAGEGKIVLTGGSPSLYDGEKGFVTGQRLTFFTRDDRLLVDGGDQSRTLSKHRIAQ